MQQAPLPSWVDMPLTGDRLEVCLGALFDPLSTAFLLRFSEMAYCTFKLAFYFDRLFWKKLWVSVYIIWQKFLKLNYEILVKWLSEQL